MKGFKINYTIDNWSGIMSIEEAWKTLDNKKIGVYFCYDNNRELIYIGKSIASIRQRLNSHCFSEPSGYLNEYNRELLLTKREAIHFFSYSEVEKDYADAVEIFLIKKFKPKFNLIC